MIKFEMPTQKIIDYLMLGFFAFFGWSLAAWVNTKIPWPT